MTCDRYWRDGIVLVERGLDDPHRASCRDCTRAHASRQELVDALPLIGAGATGDPRWQANVWRRIDAERGRRPWRWRSPLESALVVACAIGLLIGIRDPDRPEGRVASLARVDVLPGSGETRSLSAKDNDRLSAKVNDRLQVTARSSAEIRIYRAQRRELLCGARAASDRCKLDRDGMIAEIVLSAPGTYRVIVFDSPVDSPVELPGGTLDEDLAVLEAAGIGVFDEKVGVH